MSTITDKNQKKPFEEVYEENYRKIYNAVYMRVLNRENAEDIVQETFIKAMNAYDRYDPSIASLSTWLSRIAVNATIDRMRRDNRGKIISFDEYLEQGIEQGAEDPELTRLTDNDTKELYGILKKLNDKERELLTMRFVLEFSYKEIAEQLSSNEKAIARRVERLLDKCRRIRDREGGTLE